MNEELRCPHCKGDKLQKRGNEEYECLYCGGIFRYNPPVTETPYEYSTNNVPVSNVPNVNVNVNVGTPQEQPQDNVAAKAAAGAAAGVAGGCLAGTAIYFAGPIIFLIWLMAMCS